MKKILCFAICASVLSYGSFCDEPRFSGVNQGEEVGPREKFHQIMKKEIKVDAVTATEDEGAVKSSDSTSTTEFGEKAEAKREDWAKKYKPATFFNMDAYLKSTSSDLNAFFSALSKIVNSKLSSEGSSDPSQLRQHNHYKNISHSLKNFKASKGSVEELSLFDVMELRTNGWGDAQSNSTDVLLIGDVLESLKTQTTPLAKTLIREIEAVTIQTIPACNPQNMHEKEKEIAWVEPEIVEAVKEFARTASSEGKGASLKKTIGDSELEISFETLSEKRVVTATTQGKLAYFKDAYEYAMSLVVFMELSRPLAETSLEILRICEDKTLLENLKKIATVQVNAAHAKDFQKKTSVELSDLTKATDENSLKEVLKTIILSTKNGFEDPKAAKELLSRIHFELTSSESVILTLINKQETSKEGDLGADSKNGEGIISSVNEGLAKYENVDAVKRTEILEKYKGEFLVVKDGRYTLSEAALKILSDPKADAEQKRKVEEAIAAAKNSASTDLGALEKESLATKETPGDKKGSEPVVNPDESKTVKPVIKPKRNNQAINADNEKIFLEKLGKNPVITKEFSPVNAKVKAKNGLKLRDLKNPETKIGGLSAGATAKVDGAIVKNGEVLAWRVDHSGKTGLVTAGFFTFEKDVDPLALSTSPKADALKVGGVQVGGVQADVSSLSFEIRKTIQKIPQKFTEQIFKTPLKDTSWLLKAENPFLGSAKIYFNQNGEGFRNIVMIRKRIQSEGHVLSKEILEATSPFIKKTWDRQKRTYVSLEGQPAVLSAYTAKSCVEELNKVFTKLKAVLQDAK